MKVPTIESAQVLPGNPYSNTAPNLREADLGMAQAVSNAGKQFGAVGQAWGGELERQRQEDEAAKKKALAEAEAAKKRAKEVQILDGLADLHRATSDEEQKFLGMKGTDAAEQSGKTLDALDEKLNELADRFTDPEQRAEFIARGKAVVLAPRKSVEIHTRSEFEAGAAASLNALMESAEKGAGAGKLNGEELGLQVASIDKSIDALYRNPEVAKAKKAEARGRIAASFIQARIEAGDADSLEVAEQALADSQTVLGEKPAQVLRNNLDVAKKKAERVKVEADASDSTAKLALKVTGKDGFVVDAEFRAAANAARPPPGPAQDAWDKAMEEEARRQKARLAAEIDKQQNLADLADLENRPIEPEVVTFLKKHDARYLLGIQARQRAEARAARVAREGTEHAKRELRREQKETDKEFEDAYRTALLDDPKLNPQKFIIGFVAKQRELYGQDVTISQGKRTELERIGAEKANTDETKDNSAVKDFRGDMEKLLTAQADKAKGRIVNPEEIQKDVAKAVGEYERQMRENGGKPLTPAEVALLKAKAIGLREKTPAKKVGPITYQKATYEQGVDSFPDPEPRPPSGTSTDDGGYAAKARSVRAAEEWLRSPQSARDPNRDGVIKRLQALKRELGMR